jgi:hypothetical protein
MSIPIENGAVTSVDNVRILRFTAKISWEGRQNGLPEEIYSFVFYDARMSPSDIAKLVEGQLAVYRNLGGIPVEQDQGQIIDLQASLADRILVPMQWIVYIHPRIMPISGPTPLRDEEGVERLPNGKEAPKN